MLDLTPLVQRLKGSPLENWADDLQQQLDAKMAVGHGDLGRWQAALDALPAMLPSQIDLLNSFTLDNDCDDATRQQVRDALLACRPGARGRSTCLACMSTPNGARTGSGRGSLHTSTCAAGACWMSVAATATTSGGCSVPAPKA